LQVSLFEIRAVTDIQDVVAIEGCLSSAAMNSMDLPSRGGGVVANVIQAWIRHGL
jgi:hypothetical protein